MKPALLYSRQEFPMNLEKVNSCIYYSLENDTFYRMNIMPKFTAFVSEDVQENEVITLTKYDPIFLMITMLLTNKSLKAESLPHYLQKRNWSHVSTEENINDKVEYSRNKEKIFEYLEKKVKVLENYFHLKNPLDRLNFVKNEGKFISPDTISLLKNELNPDFVSEFVKERFDISQSRKIVPQIEENEALKPKPSKNNKKPTSVSKPEYLPKNQPTLFSSFKKK